MYGVIQRYDFEPLALAKVIQRVEEGVALRMREDPKFMSHRIVDLGGGVLLSIAAFADHEAARGWADGAVEVRDQGLCRLLIRPPEVVIGRTHSRTRATRIPPLHRRRTRLVS